jgi:hypothetical protein
MKKFLKSYYSEIFPSMAMFWVFFMFCLIGIYLSCDWINLWTISSTFSISYWACSMITYYFTWYRIDKL